MGCGGALAPSFGADRCRTIRKSGEGRVAADALELDGYGSTFSSELVCMSDPMAEEMLYDSEAMRRLCRDRSRAMTAFPDEDPILNFAPAGAARADRGDLRRS